MRGREQEFTEFFAAHATGLRRTAYLVVHDWHLAEDLTQQGMAKLYVVWRRARPETRLAYARRIVVNECLSHLRRQRLETATEAVSDRPVPSPFGKVVGREQLDVAPLDKLTFERSVKVVKSETLITYVSERVAATDRDPASAAFRTPVADLVQIGTDPQLVMPVPPPGDNGCPAWSMPMDGSVVFCD